MTNSLSDAELDSILSYQDAIHCMRLRFESQRELTVKELVSRLIAKREEETHV